LECQGAQMAPVVHELRALVKNFQVDTLVALLEP
jgi:hypothetical protein